MRLTHAATHKRTRNQKKKKSKNSECEAEEEQKRRRRRLSTKPTPFALNARSLGQRHENKTKQIQKMSGGVRNKPSRKTRQTRATKQHQTADTKY